ncbi:MAG: hypothetical protein IPK84_04825 [Candidatus Moraniibacteriota bacterium]|nr:MAG: hypothetical protein IPK84_04825 [Candidatus Moranbacteria bacterium]
MKVLVSRDSIVLQFRFFKVIIPKRDNVIFYHVQDLSKTVGIPIQLMILPEKYTVSFFGRIVLSFFYLFEFSNRTVYIPRSLNYIHPDQKDFHSKKFSLLESLAIPPLSAMFKVEGKERISDTLNDLDVYGYDVKQVLQDFQVWLEAPLEKKFILGTVERRNDRMMLVLVSGIPFLLGFSFLFIVRGNFEDISVPIISSLIVAFVMAVFYVLLRRK